MKYSILNAGFGSANGNAFAESFGRCGHCGWNLGLPVAHHPRCVDSPDRGQSFVRHNLHGVDLQDVRAIIYQRHDN